MTDWRRQRDGSCVWGINKPHLKVPWKTKNDKFAQHILALEVSIWVNNSITISMHEHQGVLLSLFIKCQRQNHKKLQKNEFPCSRKKLGFNNTPDRWAKNTYFHGLVTQWREKKESWFAHQPACCWTSKNANTNNKINNFDVKLIKIIQISISDQ